MTKEKLMPRGLMVLFFSEMWERFCYYGMRALLTLYLIQSLFKGEDQSYAIYATYAALIYASPVLGGRIADKILGYKNAVILGGILMSIGEFLILGGTDHWLYLGMGALVIGNGYFKANVSTIVGKLYKDNDPRRDSGFTIFYMGINLGALLATTIVAEIGSKIGYKYGFALAGIGMIIGAATFVLGHRPFADKITPPDPEKLYKKRVGPFNLFHLIIGGSILAVPVIYFLISYNNIVGWLLGATAIYVAYTLLDAGIKGGKILLHRMIVFIILLLFNVFFWSFYEQAGTSLTVFAKQNVNRHIFGGIMSAPTTQFFNPFFIIALGPLFSILWIKLSKMNRNPSIPRKFGLAIIQLGLGFLMVQVGALFVHDSLVPLFTIVLLYFLHTTGELCISPIGLSMVTKLAPKNMAGTMMGAWFLSWAAANYLAGQVAKLTGSDMPFDKIPKAESLATFLKVYSSIGIVAVGVGIILVIISRPLNKLMHGVE